MLRQLALLAIALATGIAMLPSSSHAASEECPAPRTTLTPVGVATIVEPGLCQIELVEGATIVRWDRPPRSPDSAFLDRVDPDLQGFSVWHHNPERLVWSAWGPAAPAAVATIDRLETGEVYFIDSPAIATWDLRPRERSAFDDRQVVSFYGYPNIPGMGILGRHSPDGAVAAAAIEAARYDALNGDTEVVPAVHPIVAVAQRYPGADGTYLARMSHQRIAAYVEAARDAGALVILDVQVGWAEPVEELRRLEPYLIEPFVHVALDPEFGTRTLNVAPGKRIGTLHADQINEVQRYLATLVAEHALPPKALIIHQFLERMIGEPQVIESHDEVEITIDMDGFGGSGIKLLKYGWYALADYAEQPAIKLFYNWDTPLLSPAEIQALEVPPALIIYQ